MVGKEKGSVEASSSNRLLIYSELTDKFLKSSSEIEDNLFLNQKNKINSTYKMKIKTPKKLIL